MSLASVDRVVQIIKHRHDSVMHILTCLFANAMAGSQRLSQELKDMKPSFFFPMLTGKDKDVRRYLVGAIANASTHKNLLAFVEESGVLLLCTALNSRVYFTEHFPLVLELARVLSNLSTNPAAHAILNTEEILSFLGDLLHFNFAPLAGLLEKHHGALKKHGAVPEDSDEEEEKE